MRELRFRAWDKDSSRMFYSDSQEDAKIIGAILGESCIAKFFERFYGQEIMQYTGLKDKNGKEIYEGDIVNEGNGDGVNPEIKFIDGAFRLVSEDTATVSIWGTEYDILAEACCLGNILEIIGNIYENPELVKE